MVSLFRSSSANTRPRRLALAAVLVWAVAVFLLQAAGYWRSFEARLQDKLVEPRAPSGDVVIVAIDDASIARIGRWPWDRYEHARMLDWLRVAGADAIGYDVTFSEPSDEGNDDALEAALRRTPKVVLPKEADVRAGDGRLLGFDVRVQPLARFASAAGGRVGHATLVADADGVVRRAAPADAFAAYLAGCCLKSPVLLRIPFHGPPGTFPTYAFADVIEGKVSGEAFRGKIVLVGATAPDLHDAALTPFGGGQLMSGVEIHANIVAGLREGRALSELPAPLAAGLYAALVLLVAALLSRLRLRYGLPLAALAALAYVFFALLAAGRGWLLPVWYALLAIGGAAVIELAFRYVSERARRRKIRDAFGRYLAPKVIRRLESGEVPLALGGARQEATILFSDIRGFTALSERLDPEALVSLLNEYLTAMTGLILDEEGVVDKYIGDAIMAFWNAPEPQNDHVGRAGRAALRMRARLAELNAGWKERGLPDVRMGIGINAGEVVVGNMGSEQRFDYTAIGDEVNLASRLEGLTKLYGATILVTDAARARLGEAFLCRRLDRVVVKGKEVPVGVHELMCLSADADDHQRELASDFESALALYVGRRFAEAEAAFLALAGRFADEPSRLYAGRCAAFKTAPPPAGWDGRFTAQEK